jgi:protein-tyrosine phosphatase
MKKIIFVCLGNICRSPLAEGVAKSRAKVLGVEIQIDSAGLSKYHNGEAPCMVSQRLAKAHGIDISHQVSQHISEFDLFSYDLVVAMDESNKVELECMGVQDIKKIGDFGFAGKDVADLYYEPEKTEEVWQMISNGVERIITS